MAKKKLYLLSPLDTASFGPFSESVPADALMSPALKFNTSTGSAKPSSGTSAEMRLGSTAVPGDYTTDSTANKPAGILSATAGRWNTYRAGPYTGIFSAGLWNTSYTLYNDSSNSIQADFRIIMKVSKSTDANGQTGLTTYPRFFSDQQTASITASGATRTAILLGSWDAPEIEVNNEYLFFSMAVIIDVQESNTVTRLVGFRESADTFIETTDLQPPGVTLIGAVGI